MPDLTIKQILIGADNYELAPKYIRDTVNGDALHTWADILALVNASKLPLVTVTTLPTASAETVGAIYLVSTGEPKSGTYVEWITLDKGASADPRYVWEKIGTTAADLTEYLKKDTEYPAAALSSGAHTHTVSGTVTVPTVSKTDKKLTVSRTTDVALSTSTKTVLTGLGTATTATAITGFGSHTSDTFVKSYPGATSKLVTTTLKGVAGTTTVSSVTSAGSKTNGTAASWGATVTSGVLQFNWTANTPTAVTLPTFSAVTVATANANATTLATGALASDGGGSAVMTGLGTATTAKALTALGTASTDTFVKSYPGATGTVLSSVTVQTQPVVTLSNTATSGIAFVESVTVGTTSASLANGAAASNGAHTHTVRVNS